MLFFSHMRSLFWPYLYFYMGKLVKIWLKIAFPAIMQPLLISFLLNYIQIYCLVNLGYFSMKFRKYGRKCLKLIHLQYFLISWYLFYECTYAQNLWNQLWLYLSEKVALPVLNPQSGIFDFTDVLDHNYLLVNHLLLIFKYNIYNSRVNNTLSFQSLKCVISQIKYIEETISNNDLNKKRKISNKWKLIDHLF